MFTQGINPNQNVLLQYTELPAGATTSGIRTIVIPDSKNPNVNKLNPIELVGSPSRQHTIYPPISSVSGDVSAQLTYSDTIPGGYIVNTSLDINKVVTSTSETEYYSGGSTPILVEYNLSSDLGYTPSQYLWNSYSGIQPDNPTIYNLIDPTSQVVVRRGKSIKFAAYGSKITEPTTGPSTTDLGIWEHHKDSPNDGWHFINFRDTLDDFPIKYRSNICHTTAISRRLYFFAKHFASDFISCFYESSASPYTFRAGCLFYPSVGSSSLPYVSTVKVGTLIALASNSGRLYYSFDDISSLPASQGTGSITFSSMITTIYRSTNCVVKDVWGHDTIHAVIYNAYTRQIQFINHDISITTPTSIPLLSDTFVIEDLVLFNNTWFVGGRTGTDPLYAVEWFACKTSLSEQTEVGDWEAVPSLDGSTTSNRKLLPMQG